MEVSGITLYETTHAATSSRTGACISNSVVTLLLSSVRLAILQILPVGLECRDNVQLWCARTRTRADGSSVNHHTGPVQSSHLEGALDLDSCTHEMLDVRSQAISTPGMFLSQPGMTTIPSSQCPPAAVSTWSAMRSRDCREYDIPAVPILIPSLTPTVPNWYPMMPASVSDLLTC